MSRFLTIPEEILLLSIDESGGISPESKTLDVVIASALLMDLAIRKRIDSDLHYLIHVDGSPTGDAVLDDALTFLFEDKTQKAPVYWISQLGLRADAYKEDLLASLVLKRVLKVENKRILWMFATRRYPVIGNQELKEVKARVRELIFGNELPELQDMAIISLAYYGSLLELIFAPEEIDQYLPRIEQIARMDLIGQNIGKALHELSLSFQISSKAKALLGIKTPEQKLEELVLEIRTKFRIEKDEDLPAWLRKGTDQYRKTLQFIDKEGTSDVYYHPGKQQYFVRDYASVFSR
ncbi:MAG TPA: GPP34 family phosphoprotein [Bacteroidales bacterium]|nr:GPP34 family phosphoprotein [Bacteroidales bacterium]HSA44410.1 GPP34 family phosphoprotein [Bacteroidales bacterium]